MSKTGTRILSLVLVMGVLQSSLASAADAIRSPVLPVPSQKQVFNDQALLAPLVVAAVHPFALAQRLEFIQQAVQRLHEWISVLSGGWIERIGTGLSRIQQRIVEARVRAILFSILDVPDKKAIRFVQPDTDGHRVWLVFRSDTLPVMRYVYIAAPITSTVDTLQAVVDALERSRNPGVEPNIRELRSRITEAKAPRRFRWESARGMSNLSVLGVLSFMLGAIVVMQFNLLAASALALMGLTLLWFTKPNATDGVDSNDEIKAISEKGEWLDELFQSIGQLKSAIWVQPDHVMLQDSRTSVKFLDIVKHRGKLEISRIPMSDRLGRVVIGPDEFRIRGFGPIPHHDNFVFKGSRPIVGAGFKGHELLLVGSPELRWEIKKATQRSHHPLPENLFNVGVKVVHPNLADAIQAQTARDPEDELQVVMPWTSFGETGFSAVNNVLLMAGGFLAFAGGLTSALGVLTLSIALWTIFRGGPTRTPSPSSLSPVERVIRQAA